MNAIPLLAANPLGNFWVTMILMIAIFYFLLIRPQQRREKERRDQIAALRAGAHVMFCGGMIGVIEEVKEATFMVRVAANTVVEISRAAVERPLPMRDAASASAEAKKA